MIKIEHDSNVFGYEFDCITFEQAELAKALGEWKYHQGLNQPDEFTAVTRSGASHWKLKIASFLFTPLTDERPGAFAFAEAVKNEKAIAAMPAAAINEPIEAAIQDFFLKFKMQNIGSALLSNVYESVQSRMLSMLFGMNNTQKEQGSSNYSNPPGMTAKSTGE